MQTLRERLTDWSDIDTSMSQLAQALGLFEPGESGPKWLYWSKNPTGELLYRTLESLKELGILEFREDGPTDCQFRWNTDYQPPRRPPTDPEAEPAVAPDR
jgi:hypothetical protein